jgi:GNAT superfamily N-acetyltransferase
MSCTTMPGDEWIVGERPEIGRLVIRRFDAGRDSMALVTKLLRRASAPFADEGLLRADHAAGGPVPGGPVAGTPAAGTPVAGVHAAGAHTAGAPARVGADEAQACFVAVCGGRIAGTITLREPDTVSACSHFRRRDVATFQRFGVDPSLQRRGIGRALLSFGNRWAAAHGYLQLALDMPVTRTALLDYFHAQGFSLIDTVRFAGRDYDSAVLSRPTWTGWPCYSVSRAMHRTRGGR